MNDTALLPSTQGPIKLSEIFKIEAKDFEKYNIHFATKYKDEGASAYDTFIDHRASWISCWNTNKGHEQTEKIAFTREFVISFIKMNDNEWLFGGVIDRDGKNNEENPHYAELNQSMIGRLVITYKNNSKCIYRLMKEDLWDKLEVKEIKAEAVSKKGKSN